MPKKDPILAALGECPEKWDTFFLKTYRLPQDPSTRKEIQQDSLPRNKKGRRLTLDDAGESATQSTDELISLHQEAAVNQKITLSQEWLLCLEYMGVFAEALSPKDKGAALKQIALADARSRYWEQPPAMPSSLGTPAELMQRWRRGEIEIQARTANRRKHVIEIREHSIPPDEPEDADEAGEPSGHYDGPNA